MTISWIGAARMAEERGDERLGWYVDDEGLHVVVSHEEYEKIAADTSRISRRNADLIAGIFHTDPNQTVREYIDLYEGVPLPQKASS